MSAEVKKHKLLTSRNSLFVDALIRSGVMPANCRRLVIDIKLNTIDVYAETIADDRLDDPALLNVVMTLGAQIVTEGLENKETV